MDRGRTGRRFCALLLLAALVVGVLGTTLSPSYSTSNQSHSAAQPGTCDWFTFSLSLSLCLAPAVLLHWQRLGPAGSLAPDPRSAARMLICAQISNQTASVMMILRSSCYIPCKSPCPSFREISCFAYVNVLLVGSDPSHMVSKMKQNPKDMRVPPIGLQDNSSPTMPLGWSSTSQPSPAPQDTPNIWGGGGLKGESGLLDVHSSAYLL